MGQLSIPPECHTLYRFMSAEQRLLFGAKLIDCRSDEELSTHTLRHYNELFSDVLKEKGTAMNIGIIAGKTSTGDSVNIVMAGDMIFINSDKLIPIRDIVKTMTDGGDILIHDKESSKKTDKNRHRYHMRYYRAYRRVNYASVKFPISKN